MHTYALTRTRTRTCTSLICMNVCANIFLVCFLEYYTILCRDTFRSPCKCVQGCLKFDLGAMPPSKKDFQLWGKHTPEQWQQWVAELPPAGHWSYSLEDWREWLQMMMGIQEDVNAAPRKRQLERKTETRVPPRSPSPSPTSVPDDFGADWKEEEPEASPSPTVTGTEDSDDGFFECISGCSPRDPAQGPLAQGQASSSSAGPAPAQGPPAQGHVIGLQGARAREKKAM